MKIIDEKNQVKNIVLEDDDILEISTLKRNNETIIVKCLNGILHIEELTSKQIKDKKQEEEAIKAMKDYLSKNEDN